MMMAVKSALRNTKEVAEMLTVGTHINKKTIMSAAEKAQKGKAANAFTHDELRVARAKEALIDPAGKEFFPKGVKGAVLPNGDMKLDSGWQSILARYHTLPDIEGASSSGAVIAEDALSVAGVTAAAIVGLKVTQGAVNLAAGGPDNLY